MTITPTEAPLPLTAIERIAMEGVLARTAMEREQYMKIAATLNGQYQEITESIATRLGIPTELFLERYQLNTDTWMLDPRPPPAPQDEPIPFPVREASE